MKTRLQAWNRRQPAFTLVELLVVIAIIGILIALLLPAVQAAREAARRSQCLNNMKQLALGMHNYHDVYNKLPTQDDIIDPCVGASRKWGWPTRILPYIEQDGLFDQLKAGSPPPPAGQQALECLMPTSNTLFNGEALLQRPIQSFICPSNGFTSNTNPIYENFAKSNYVSNQDLIPSFPTVRRTEFRDILDGLTLTLMFGERVLGTGPNNPKGGVGAIVYGRVPASDASLAFHAGHPINTFNKYTTATGSSDPRCQRFAVSSYHPMGVIFAFCDGSSKFVSQNISFNPASIPTSSACISGSANPPRSGIYGTQGPGPGFVYQNLYNISDANVVQPGMY